MPGPDTNWSYSVPLTHSCPVLKLVSFWKENKFKAHLQQKVIIFERTVQGFSLEAGT